MIFYKFFPADYALATRHLSNTENLCYRLMLDLYYHRDGDVKNDCKWIAKKINMIGEEEKVQKIIDEFFVVNGERISQRRADSEISETMRRSVSASASAKTRWGHLNAVNGNDAPNDAHSPHMPPAAKEKPKNILAAERVLTYLNHLTDRYYRPTKATLAMISARLKDYSEGDIIAVISSKCREWENDPKMEKYLRPATLFSASKFDSYFGQAKKSDHPTEADMNWYMTLKDRRGEKNEIQQRE